MSTHIWTPDTAEMALWTSEEEAPNGTYTWGVYTDLGAFRPRWKASDRLVPYARRLDHSATHTVHSRVARRGRMRQWVISTAREIGHAVADAFFQVGEFA